MKSYKLFIFILVVFFKTETLLSDSSLFNVNNIQLEKKDKISNKSLADVAIKKGFNELTEKILGFNSHLTIKPYSRNITEKFYYYLQTSPKFSYLFLQHQ